MIRNVFRKLNYYFLADYDEQIHVSVYFWFYGFYGICFTVAITVFLATF